MVAEKRQRLCGDHLVLSRELGTGSSFCVGLGGLH